MNHHTHKTITIKCPDCHTQLETFVKPTMSRAEDRRIQFALLDRHKKKECTAVSKEVK